MAGARRFWAFISYSHQDRRLGAVAAPHHRVLSLPIAGGRPSHARGTRPAATAADLQRPRRPRRQPSPAGRGPGRPRPIQRLDRRLFAGGGGVRLGQGRDQPVHRPRGSTRVFALIVGGSPNASDPATDCFPAGLRGPDGRAELIAADLRPGGDGRRLAQLKLVAGILGVDLDDLVRRDAHRRTRALAALTAVAFAVSLAMAGLTAIALIARDEARDQRAQAESLVAFMLGDLRKKLEPTGRLDLLDAVAKRTMSYYAAQRPHSLDDAALGQRARALHLLGELADRRGQLDEAQASFGQAAITTGELLRRSPGDGVRLFDHAQSLYYLGEIAGDKGDLTKAKQYFAGYLIAAKTLARINPRRGDWLAEVAYASADLGTVDLLTGQPRRAVVEFALALRIGTALASRAPDDRDRQADMAQYYAWLSDGEAALGDIRAATSHRSLEMRVYRHLLALQPGDNDAAKASIVADTAMARLWLRQSKPFKALTMLNSAAREAARLCTTMKDDRTCDEDRTLSRVQLRWSGRDPCGPSRPHLNAAIDCCTREITRLGPGHSPPPAGGMPRQLAAFRRER